MTVRFEFDVANTVQIRVQSVGSDGMQEEWFINDTAAGLDTSRLEMQSLWLSHTIRALANSERDEFNLDDLNRLRVR